MDRKLEASGRKLCNPLTQTWTKLPEEDEKTVLAMIKRIFEKYQACMRTVRKPPKWDKDREVNQLTDKEQDQKTLFKSWFVIGTNKVVRSLEKDELCLVLRKMDLQGVLAKSMLSLAVSHQCPAVCVSELLSAIQAGWPDITSVSVFAVKRMTKPNDFSELVNFVRSVLPEPHVSEVQSQDKGDKAIPDSCSKGNLETEETVHSDKSSAGDKGTDMKTHPDMSSPPASSSGDQFEENTQRQTVKVVVDPTKYYVLKKDQGSGKTFDGEDFIAFGEELVEDNHIYVVNGKASSSSRRGHEQKLYGIAPAFFEIDSAHTATPFLDRKRLLDDSSEYKGITIKQAKRDMNSAKQKKKQQKRLRKIKVKGKKA